MAEIPHQIGGINVASIDLNSFAEYHYDDYVIILPDRVNTTNIAVPSGAIFFKYSVDNNNEVTITDIILGRYYEKTGVPKTINGMTVIGVDESVRNKVYEKGHDHAGGIATCTEKAVCIFCGREYGTVKAHNFSIDGICTECGAPDTGDETAAPEPSAPAVYTISFVGDYMNSGVTVTGTGTAGSVMTVNVPSGYSVTAACGSNVIARLSEGTSTFIMPDGNVTVSVDCYFSAIYSGFVNSYIYSYDSNMNYIKTNSLRSGMTERKGVVTVKLGKEICRKVRCPLQGQEVNRREIGRSIVG